MTKHSNQGAKAKHITRLRIVIIYLKETPKIVSLLQQPRQVDGRLAKLKVTLCYRSCACVHKLTQVRPCLKFTRVLKPQPCEQERVEPGLYLTPVELGLVCVVKTGIVPAHTATHLPTLCLFCFCAFS